MTRSRKYPIQPRRTIKIELLDPKEREEKVKQWYKKKEKETKKLMVEEELMGKMKELKTQINKKKIEDVREKIKLQRELEFERLLKKPLKKRKYIL